MTPSNRKDYLTALGIETWVLRSAPAAAAAAQAGPAVMARPVAREEGGDWTQLRARVAACTRCSLSATRTQTVFGVGNLEADWLIVGEAPGAEEDKRG
jgi:hypothetical protein